MHISEHANIIECYKGIITDEYWDMSHLSSDAVDAAIGEYFIHLIC